MDRTQTLIERLRSHVEPQSLAAWDSDNRLKAPKPREFNHSTKRTPKSGLNVTRRQLSQVCDLWTFCGRCGIGSMMKPTKTDYPTPVELELLKQLWREGRLSARELHERTAQFTRWSYSSTRKTLDRMLEKGLLAASDLHGVRVFRARVRKLATIAALSRDFARRVLGSAPATPIASFVESDFLSNEEVEELKSMLAEGD